MATACDEHQSLAKRAVGKAPKQPALPEPRPGDPLEWSRDGTPPKRARPLPKSPEKKRRKRHKIRTPLPDRHPLTSDVKPLFEAGRLSYSADYLKPAKRLLVDLTARIPAIIRELEKATIEVARLERQRWAVQMEQWDRKEAERRAAKALKESKEERCCTQPRKTPAGIFSP